jgi:hypothetical protein
MLMREICLAEVSRRYATGRFFCGGSRAEARGYYCAAASRRGAAKSADEFFPLATLLEVGIGGLGQAAGFAQEPAGLTPAPHLASEPFGFAVSSHFRRVDAEFIGSAVHGCFHLIKKFCDRHFVGGEEEFQAFPDILRYF